MITLKAYQRRVLDSLRDFFRQCSESGRPEIAFRAVQAQNGRPPMHYLPVSVPGLAPEMPYICIRVPTGGGKTLMACAAGGLAMDELLHAERAVILWLVPSNTILDQTAEALRNPRHPYRRQLELSCGSVEVLRIEEALQLSRATVDGHTVVIVATIQAFRVEDTTGRRVYEQNGYFAEHLLNIPADRLVELVPGPDGRPRPSLVNMLRLRRPIVIVDEAHNARTELSFAALGNVLPSCILEFTATPDRTRAPSNVLYHVSAAELKAADMIKLPLRVVSRHPSQQDQLLADALALRADLEKLAIQEGQETSEYLRPILLIQAERVDACQPLRTRLIGEYGMSEDQIKISVGSLDELKNLTDISTPRSPIRIIITVQKLREGWDCPFAYVLCSLKQTRSSTAIEQLVGRILRLPNARAKQHPDLNCAYAFSVCSSITDVLAELHDALEANGFTSAEADRLIIPGPQGTLPLGLQSKTIHISPQEIDVAAITAQMASLTDKVRIDTTTGAITVLVPLDATEAAALTACVSTPEAKAKVDQVVAMVRDLNKAFGGTGGSRKPCPYERNLDFIVPILCVQENGQLFEFESTFLLEHPWRLSAKDASLSKGYNPLLRPTGEAGMIDVDQKGGVQILAGPDTADTAFIATLHQQVLALTSPEDWTLERLVGWLDQHIEHRDIPEGESGAFLHKVIRGLTTTFAISDINTLAMDRFRLRNEIDKRIQEHRLAERKEAFTQLLLPDSGLTVSPERTINFRTMSYEPSWLYDGAFQFRKHYFGPKPGELLERTPSGNLAEEFKCAQFIDGLEQVHFWVRNLARKITSFRLQTSTDWFYPDFICQLTDGRVLVVEYKGARDFGGSDAEEKRAIGEVWERRSNRCCLFIMPTEDDFSTITAKLIK